MALTRIQKISGQAFVNGVSGTKLVGFGVLGRVSTLSYYIDPNQINGFTYDAVKKSWWSETPENTGALPYAADPVTSAELDRLKKIYEQHNELEGFSASDPVPEEDPFFTPSLWKNLVEGVYAGAPVLMGKLKEAFNTASNTVSPIILDLDGDGIETVGVNDGIHFDHDGNGFSELTGWVSQDDALLVYDKNNNNSIDDGGELFGNNYSSDGVFASNGFQALADFDSNNDGVVNALDENFSKLKVWKDFSMDGVVNDGELLSLAQVGVVSLDLDFKNSDYVDGNGNQHRQLGDFLKSDGTAGSMADVWFKQDKTDTEVHQYVAIDEEISKLPDLVGFGNVYDLHEAMARDLSGALKLLVENFAAENDASKRKEIANEIIFKWTGADQYAIGSRGGYVSDARKIYAVEAFTGEFFIQGSGTNEGLRDPGPAAAAELDNAFTLVSEYYYSLLLLQTHYAKYTSQALVTFLDGDYKVDSLGVVSSLNRDYLNGEISTTDITTYFDSLKALGIYGQKVLESLRAEGNAFSGEFGELLTSAGFALVSGTAQADNLYALSSDNSFLSGLDGDDHLFGGSGDDILHGDSGSDTLESGAGSNQLFGGEGNDLLKASSGSKNNLLVGGFGDDQIYGAYLADTYLFNLGDGRDTITEYGSSYGEFDTLRFGAGILASDIRIIRVGLDLVFIHRNGTDQVTVKDWFDGTSSSANVTQDKVIEHIEFADGTSWSWADISSAGLSQVGTDGAETLTGWSGNDIIHGGGGNDTLVGGAGANQLYGDAGDDTLIVGTGSKDNLLAGGAGNDTLTGGYFADTYLFNLGDGQDTITDYDAGYVVTDTLRFGAGILASDIQVQKSGSDVVFMHRNGTDQIRVKGWFDSAAASAGVTPYNIIERVEFADGTSWSWADISAAGLNQVGTTDSDTLIGWSGNDVIHGGGGNDTLSGGAGANQLFGDAGDDTLIVATASKDNLLAGGSGNDTLTGGYFADTYLFSLGDGQDVITDYDGGNLATDTLRFGAGILASDITTRRVNSDLVFMHNNGTDQLTFKGWFDSAASSAGVVSYNVIERVEFADGTFWTWADIVATGLKQVGSEGGETLTGWSGNDIIHGGGGNDTLLGGAGANQLYGDAGDDTLVVATGSKDNLLAGGSGNDTLTGGYFADTYLFNLGDGQDTITDYDAGYAVTDTLRFGAGILASDIQVQKSGADVVFMHRNGTDQIRVKGWFDSAASSAGVLINSILERVEFADGTSWSWADISAAGLNQVGTTAADTLIGWSGNDIIRGGAGNDTLSGGAGANQLYGDAGDDTLIVATGSKDNLLAGGTGNDTLTGGYFADTYLFNLGDGQDTITDYDGGNLATDTLRFGAGILASDITTRRVNSDLVFMHNNGTDQLTFKGWFDSAASSAGVVSYNVIERVEFADGTFWTWADIVATGLKQVGSDGAETLTGWSGNDIIHGGGGNDTLVGGAGANQLYGDAGDDTLVVATGSKDNLLAGGSGNDTLTGGYFADTYLFNLGDGQDAITDYDGGNLATDTLRFGAGILASDITTRRVNSDLVFMHNNGTDQLTFKGWFDSAASSAGVVSYNVIERVEFADGTFWTWADIVATGLKQVGSEGAETLTGWSGNDIIHGGGGNDTLLGGAGANQLYGDAGDDTLIVGTGSKDNLLAGGAGNDTLTGGYFADTYLFNLGDGQDTITDYDAGYVVTDTLRFGAGILASDIQVQKSGSDVVFMHRNGTDQIRVKGWFDSAAASAGVTPYNIIERVEFADGTSWSWADISAAGLNQVGTTDSDTLIGWSGNDVIHGGGGNDTLSGGAGANQLYGDAGDDTLIVATGSKDNLLAGGTGNDTLTGGYFADTYLFNLGDGQDTITDYDGGNLATDTLRFGAGILASDITTRRVNSDLVFMHNNGTDQLTFKGWFDSAASSAGVVSYNVIERVEFADGTFWTWADIVATGLKQVGSDGAETLTGWSGNDIIHGGGGNDTLVGGAGANQLYGDAGDDTLVVATGSKDNLLAGGSGNDTLTGGYFADTYLFNLGDGQDAITDYDGGNLATDTLRFGAGILASDIQVQKSGSDVVFMHRNGTDQLTFKGWFDSAAASAGVTPYNIIERVEFADGTSWNWADISAAGLNQVGTTAADTLIGWSGNDIIRGGAGNDTLSGGAGANQLYGDAGDDVLVVAAASRGNTLAGGTGNDDITGGNFSDTYLFDRGDGQDTITDYDGGYVGTDTVAFGADISPQDLWLRHTGSNLEITVIGSNEKLTISNWYQSSNYHVEALKTADGKVLLDTQVQNLVDTMASFGVAPGAETSLTNDQRAQLDAVLAANWK